MNYSLIREFISDEQIDDLLRIPHDLNSWMPHRVYDSDNPGEFISDTSVRSSTYARVDDLSPDIFYFIGKKLTAVEPDYELNLYFPMQIIRYDPGDHFILHLDSHPASPMTNQYKRSFTILLRDADVGGDFYTTGDSDTDIIPMDPGDAIIFDSGVFPHGISRVKSGYRLSIVGRMS